MLKIKNLKKRWTGFELNASLEVPPGRITGLVGQNGAGKSTLFKSVLGLVFPDGGEIELFGKPAGNAGAEARRQIGAVLADAGFSGFLTAGDARLILRNSYPAFDENGFLEGCKRLSLPLDKPIKEMSTGMQAKLKVLCALTHGARLLLLDEPTAGLDVVARDEVLDMLRGYMEADEDRSILISSHISSDLESLCDDFYMLHAGTIALHEDTDRLLSSYGILKVGEEQFGDMDKAHLLRAKRESYGWRCLTDERGYYMENCPDIVVEKGGLDELMRLMIEGDAL